MKLQCSGRNDLIHPVGLGFALVIMLLLLSGLSYATDCVEPAASESQPTTTDGSVKTGKGPGMGHDYQKNTPGPGKGKPQYKGGKLVEEQTEQEMTIMPEQNAPGLSETDEPALPGTEANVTAPQSDAD